MNNEFSIDITEETFEQQVFEESKRTLVVIDFWAQWCEPCKNLLPVMHKLADEYAGGFLLAKVDIDQQQQLAQMFGVRSVPTVKFMKNGQLVDEFNGLLSEQEIRNKLDTHIEKESDKVFLAEFYRYQQGDKEAAITRMHEIVTQFPENTTLQLQLLKILIHEMRYSDAAALIETMSNELRDSNEVKTMATQIMLADKAGDLPGIETLTATIEKNANNLQARLDLATQFLVLGEYQYALDQLLQIIITDRTFQNDVGRHEILQVFELLNTMGEEKKQLASQYRRKLAQLLN